jgi:ABC-type microcin C transport system permease subunit YejB
VACAAVALLWRALNALGLGLSQIITRGNPVVYMTFYKGALLFLLAAVATANYIWIKGRPA